VVEEPDDGKTNAEHAAELRAAVKTSAETAVKHHREATGTARPDLFIESVSDVSQEIFAAWSEYHAALVATPVTKSPGELAELYEALRTSIANLKEFFP